MKLKKYLLNTKFLYLIIIFFIFFLYLLLNPFYTEISIEAGKSLNAPLITKRQIDSDTISFEPITFNHVSKEYVKAYFHFIPYFIRINVIDTTVPQYKISIKEFWLGDTFTAYDCIDEFSDNTNTSIKFIEEPTFNKLGFQNIKILIEDEGHNKVEVISKVKIKKDDISPIISCPDTIISEIGNSISYRKNLKVVDNKDEDVNVDIDNSGVNYNKPGVYKVYYTAIDSAGNTSRKEVDVKVLSKNDFKIKKDCLKYARIFIKQTCGDNDNKDYVLEKSFEYIRKNIKYNGKHDGDKDNYYIDALNGFKTMRGDCLVSNGMFRAVCEVLDIPTLVVERTAKGRSNHYWILANPGDGWFHYDAFNQYNKIYKWTSSYLLDWSKKHKDYMKFDVSKYPD